jgi:hypothetical protein
VESAVALQLQDRCTFLQILRFRWKTAALHRTIQSASHRSVISPGDAPEHRLNVTYRRPCAFWHLANSPGSRPRLFVFYAAGMVLTQSFNGAGDTWTPTVINLFVFWLFELPLAWYLAIGADLGPVGVFIALTVAYSSLAVVSAWLFRRGKWKTKEI